MTARDGSRRPVTVCQFVTIKHRPPNCLWCYYFFDCLCVGRHDPSPLLATCFGSVLDRYADIFHMVCLLTVALKQCKLPRIHVCTKLFSSINRAFLKSFLSMCSDHGSDVMLLRGSVFFIGMCLWGSQRVTNLKYSNSTVLPSMLQVRLLHCS